MVAMPISRVAWKDLLPGDLVENSVAIHKAVVDSFGQGEEKKQSVTLANLTNREISLTGWRIRNSRWAEQVLPRDEDLGAKATEVFEAADCHLSTDRDTITLLDRDGLKVAGVSYTSQHVKNGELILQAKVNSSLSTHVYTVNLSVLCQKSRQRGVDSNY
ncbi:hypothetical protein BDV36DRAFT_292033 [Aspergillus pseudocaelatus]|uniref:LTD domain-containing protein n=1 Tax=Aspergillus pseudocaelatus TaxID=1825620 RepID=A0ABQ6WX47_9EURO|nr:hypothetical protein BDV36DRAFT_292033 [Aspergillus pseudocaelatus]